MRRSLWITALLTAWVLASPAAQVARACPMCKFANDAKQANEDENRRPQAYMYSILFMLSMPATLFTGFSFGFYRLWKKQQALAQIAAESQPMDRPLE